MSLSNNARALELGAWLRENDNEDRTLMRAGGFEMLDTVGEYAEANGKDPEAARDEFLLNTMEIAYAINNDRPEDILKVEQNVVEVYDLQGIFDEFNVPREEWIAAVAEKKADALRDSQAQLEDLKELFQALGINVADI